MSAGEIAQTAMTAAISGRGQRAISQAASDRGGDPHHLEVLVHVELDRADHDEVGDEEEGHGSTRPGTRDAADGRARGTR